MIWEKHLGCDAILANVCSYKFDTDSALPAGGLQGGLARLERLNEQGPDAMTAWHKQGEMACILYCMTQTHNHA